MLLVFVTMIRLKYPRKKYTFATRDAFHVKGNHQKHLCLRK